MNQLGFPILSINYHLGIDGISLFIVLLTTLLSAIAVLSSWTAIKDRVKAYMVLMLLMETAMLGVFVSLDLFLFYAFWEASLIPMAFLIGVWGSDKRIYAAVKFFMYTFVGSYPRCWTRLASLPTRKSGSSSPLRWPSLLKYRSSRCTPGCLRLTCKRLPPGR